MNDALKDKPVMLVAVLAAVCVVAGLALGLVYMGTAQQIKIEEDKAKQAALTAVHPGATRFEKKTATVDGETIDYYEAYDHTGALVGYACEGTSPGYSSTITLTVGLDAAMTTITGVQITFQQETPGLGANCVKGGDARYIWQAFAKQEPGAADHGWQSQFGGRGLDLFTKEAKTYNGVDALTGATITTNAVVSAIWNGVEQCYKARGVALVDATTAATGTDQSDQREYEHE